MVDSAGHPFAGIDLCPPLDGERSEAQWQAIAAAQIAADPDPLPDLDATQVAARTAMLLVDAQTAPVGAGLLGRLADVDLAGLDADTALSVALGLDRLANHVAAHRGAAVARVVRATRPDPVLGEATVNASREIEAALSLGPRQCGELIGAALQLTDRLTDTWTAVAAGTVSWVNAATLALAVGALDDAKARAVQDRVLPHAGTRSSARHADAVRRTVDRVDPDGVEQRRRKATRDIRLIRAHYGNGMGQLFADLPAEQLDIIWTAADTWARARTTAGDPRTLDQLRCAALAHWASSYLYHGNASTCDTSCTHPTDPLIPDNPDTDDHGPDNDDSGSGDGGPDDSSPGDGGPSNGGGGSGPGDGGPDDSDAAPHDPDGDHGGPGGSPSDRPGGRGPGGSGLGPDGPHDSDAAHDSEPGPDDPDPGPDGGPHDSTPGSGSGGAGLAAAGRRSPPTRQGRPAELEAVWDLASLLGVTGECGELLDSGAVLPPSVMRTLIAGGVRMRRMVLDPDTGELLDLTPTSWTLPATTRAPHRAPVCLKVLIDATTLHALHTGRRDHLDPALTAAIDTAHPAIRALLHAPLSAESLDAHPHAPRPSAALSEFIATRDRYPTNPTAGPSPAKAADREHTLARRHGGHTTRENLTSIVRRWHNAKTHGGWTVTKTGRTWTWTSPQGRTYTTQPFDYRHGP